jgi:hypothetical protein
VTWRALATSIAGTSHRERDQPCQDAHAFRTLPDGTLLVAVADGAGSAPRSARGAALAVTHVLAAVEAALSAPVEAAERVWGDVVRAAFEWTRKALADTAADASVPLHEFHTTLTCLVATATHLIIGQIGDGAVVAMDSDGTLFTAMRPQRGEYANQAYFVTMDEAPDRLEVIVHPRPIAALAVTTDGLLRLVLHLPECAPHAAFFRPLFAFVAEADDLAIAQAELSTFLDSDRVRRRTDDDKTLVLAVRHPLPPLPRSPELAEGERGPGEEGEPS